jgi:hypothetical protein
MSLIVLENLQIERVECEKPGRIFQPFENGCYAFEPKRYLTLQHSGTTNDLMFKMHKPKGQK